MGVPRPLAPLLFVLSGCTAAPVEVPPLPVDAGLPPAWVVQRPAAAVPPAATMLEPCAPGWRASPTPEGPSTCEPWAATGPARCALDAAHFPGDGACRRVGSACAEFAEGLPSAGVLYVRQGASAGGTGTRAAPFSTIAAAMAVAAPGAVVALSQGSFVEEVRVRPGVTLWGACVAQTSVAAPAGARAALAAAGLGGGVRNLTVRGPALGVLVNPSGNTLELQDVIIDGAVGVALLVGNRAEVTGRDVVVRNTQPGPQGTGGRALSAEYGAKVSLVRVAFEDNRENAVFAAQPDTTVALTDAALRGTRARPADGTMGRAATVSQQAQLTLTRAVLEDNQEAALLVGSGASISLTDVLVRGTRSAAVLNDGGNGLVLEDGASGVLSRCAFLGNRSLGLSVRSGGQLRATHLVVRDTQVTESTGVDGAGLEAREGALVVLGHAFFSGNASAGLGFAGSSATLDDLEVRDTRASLAPSPESSGLQVKGGATVELHRVRLQGNERIGALVDGAGSTLFGSDLEVSDTRVTAKTGEDGVAVAAQAGASVSLARVLVQGSHTAALQASDPGTQVQLVDAVLRGTLSDTATGTYGRAVHLQGAARLVLERAWLSGSRDVGLFAGSGATVTATELAVEDTLKRACTAAGTCPDVGGSAVVVLGAGTTLTATRFSFARSAQCGLQLAEGGRASLVDGEVSGHPVGACVQTEGFDVAGISQGVGYRDNSRKLDSASVPLPAVTRPTY